MIFVFNVKKIIKKPNPSSIATRMVKIEKVKKESVAYRQ
jgi:hypothetical protein|tara:strand:- start:257 stop:373 length:117 start_codon:yes stop_codon:yes gene_type:complete